MPRQEAYITKCDTAVRTRSGAPEATRTTLGRSDTTYTFETVHTYNINLQQTLCRYNSHAGKYHHLSPWTFCAANPIRYSDPTGKDIYVFDQKGYIVDCISIDNFDQIRVMDNCMNITESAKMHKGTIQVNGPSDRKESRYKNP